MKIQYKRRALHHIVQIHDYIAIQDSRAASNVVHRIQHSISRLEFAPFSGRPGVVTGTRILVVPGLPYVAIYRVGDDTVDVVAILHTARRRRS